MAGLPPRTHASPLVDSIRLCTQELVGSSLCLSLCPLPPQLCPLSRLPVSPSPAACKLTSTQALFGLLPPAGCLSGPHGVQWVWRDAGALRALRWLYAQIIKGRRCVESEGVRPQAPAEKTPEHREAGYSHCKGIDDSSAPSRSGPRGPAWRGQNPGAARIQAHPHKGRSQDARRAPWRRVRGEQPGTSPASRTSPRLRESAGPEAEAEAS